MADNMSEYDELIRSNWRDANKTVAGSWGTDIDRLRVSGNVIDGGQYYVSLPLSMERSS